MFDSKKYHKEYMREYRKNVVNISPEKLERRRELGRITYRRNKKNPEWVKKNRLLHKKYAKKYYSKPGTRELFTERRREYYKTKKGSATIRKAIDRYKKKNPEKIKAQMAISYQRQIGKIKKKPCIVCGSKKVHAHHPDYSKPLHVIFLCPLHHRQEHLKST